MATFGELIRRYRKEAGWQQDDFGSKIKALLGRPESELRAGAVDLVGRMEHNDATPENARAAVTALHEELSLTRRQLSELAEAYLLDPALLEDALGQRIIAVIVPDAYRSAFWSKVVAAIEEAVQDAGYLMVIFPHNESIPQERNTLTLLGDVPTVSGLLIAPAMGSPEFPDLPALRRLGGILRDIEKRHGIPAVYIDRTGPIVGRGGPMDRIPFVGPDNQTLARLAVNELIRGGHKRIALLNDYPQATNYQERETGYNQALADHGIPKDETLIRQGVYHPHGQLVPGTHRLRTFDGIGPTIDLLSLPNPPTAFFCANYHYALDVLDALRVLEQKTGRRLSVPHDVSVITVDDLEQLDLVEPHITRLSYSIDQLGHLAVKKLLNRIDASNDPRHRNDEFIRSFTVVTRASIAPLDAHCV